MMGLSEFLGVGESQAISLEQLALATGLPERSVKAEVLRARINGELILSSDSGYFLPADDSDIRRYVASRRSYLRTAGAALQPFIKALRGEI